jgi:hypothetical protein
LKKIDTLRKFVNHCRKLQQKGWRAQLNDAEEIILTAPGAKKARYCPITAVCFEETGRFFYRFDFQASANHIGIPDDVRRYTIGASLGVIGEDDSTTTETFWALRRALLQTFGLVGSRVFEKLDYPERKKFNERLRNPRTRVGRIVSTEALRKSSQHIQRVIAENIVAHGAGAILRRH